MHTPNPPTTTLSTRQELADFLASVPAKGGSSHKGREGNNVYRRLFLMALAKTRNAQNANDLVSKTLVKAFSYLERVERDQADAIVSPKAWLTLVLSRTWQDMCTLHTRQQTLLAAHAPTATSNSISTYSQNTSSVLSTRLAAVDVENIVMFLRQQGAEDRDIRFFLAHELESRSWNELGQQYGVSPDMIRKRVTRNILPKLEQFRRKTKGAVTS